MKALGAGANGQAEGGKENVDIYVMPKEFQKHNKVVSGSNNSGMTVMIIGIAALLVLGGALYLYFFQSGFINSLFGGTQPPVTEATSTVPVASTTMPVAPVTPTSTLPASNPQDIYLAFNKAVKAASVYNDYVQAVALYGSDSLKEKVKADRTLVEISPESALRRLNTIKLDTPPLTGTETMNFEILPDAKTAVLKIVLADGVSSGTISLLLENDAWRVDNEAWTLKPVAVPAATYLPCLDRDKDQLCDKEEDLLGTSNDNPDTDGDHYQDGAETLNLFNPNGNNKLIDNPAINRYLNPELGFSVLVPTKSNKWVPVASGATEGSVTFNSDDGQYFMVLSDLNANNESLDQYYLRVMEAGSIADSQRLTGQNWKGIMTNDGLKVYITDNKGKRIYVLQYEPGPAKVLDYIHLFEAMVKSFVVI